MLNVVSGARVGSDQRHVYPAEACFWNTRSFVECGFTCGMFWIILEKTGMSLQIHLSTC